MKTPRLAAAGVLAAAVLGAQALPALAQPNGTTVSVMEQEFSMKLSKRALKKGTVTFTVMNHGQLPHDFKIAGKKSAIIAPGATGKLTVKFAKAGRYAFTCTVAGHAASGMKGSLTVR
jgi:uncharacterized cupredoxin-like copper-binding protein